jgi:hypothetical protein
MSIGNIEAILRAKSVLPIAVGPIRQIMVGDFFIFEVKLSFY